MGTHASGPSSKRGLAHMGLVVLIAITLGSLAQVASAGARPRAGRRASVRTASVRNRARSRSSRATPSVLLVGTYNGKAGQFSTIQEAVDAAKPGDWILIGPGDYKQTSTRFASGAL